MSSTGCGADRLDGGLGNDTFFIDNISDKVVEANGAGVDIVRTSVSYMLLTGVAVETLRALAHIDRLDPPDRQRISPTP